MAKQLSAIEQLQNSISDNRANYKEMKEAEKAQYFALRDQAAHDVVSSPENYIGYLNVQSALFRLGTANVLAVAAQNPGATILKTKAEWREAGRSLKDAEAKPILIRQRDEQSGYMNIYQMYDIGQTEGRYFPIKRLTLDEMTVVEANQTLLKQSKVPIVGADGLELPAFFDPQAAVILVRANLSHTEIFRHLPHELALSQLPHEGYNREAYRIEAESVAYVIHKHFGAEKLFAEHAKKTKQEDFAKMPDFANIGQLYGGFSKDEIISALTYVRDQAYNMCSAVERSISPPARHDFSRMPIRPAQTQAR